MERNDIGEIENLLKLKCIEQMGNRYRDIWTNLVERYAPRLNDSPLLKKVAFTNHDFSHHCKDIYVLIDSVLLKSITLQEEEYFVLAVAVLMHDISMTTENFDRLCHSEQSAKYIQDEINKGEDVWQNVPVQHIPVIKQLVTAHSDIKRKEDNGKTEILKYTLQETTEMMKGEFGQDIHVKWLAGILRLADELDITNSRMRNGENRYKNLDSEDEAERESQLCWEQLNYFKEVTKQAAIIKLIINEQYMKAHIEDDRGNIIERIRNIYNKIADCIKEVKENVFDVSEDYTISISRVVISDRTKIFSEDELGDILEKTSSKNIPSRDIDEARIAFDDNDRNDVVSNQMNEDDAGEVELGCDFERKEIEEKITRYIYSHNLIQHGHYRLNRRFCSKDWIDVRAMLSEHEIGSEIVNLFVKDLEKVILKDSKDILAIGVSMNGNILASQVAFKLELPFTYLVPCKPGMEGSDMEREFKLGGAKKVILFTGVISSYDTITNIINEYLMGVEIIKIYTVLLRPINDEYYLDEKREHIKTQIQNKIMYLNTDFDCEMISGDKCINAKYGECIAQNKQAYDEVYQWSLAVKDEEDHRVFVNNVIGCDCDCAYCYLHNIGIWKKEVYTVDEVVSEFERLHGVNPEDYIISIGCYAECMQEENISNIIKMVEYFAQKRYYIQISTKTQIKRKWFEELEQVLLFPRQLNIFVSMSTLTQADRYEKGAVDVQDRISNFEYVSQEQKICIYMYIKPYLTGITNKDGDRYLELVKKHNMKVIIGNRFNFDTFEGTPVQVGTNKMYETESDDMEEFVSSLQQETKVYRHSIEPIVEMMKGEN